MITVKEDITDMLLSRHVQSYGKCPDGATVVPWSRGQLLVWYATCPDTLATSYDARLHVLPARLQLLPKRGKSTSMSTLAKHTSLRQWPLKHGCLWPKDICLCEGTKEESKVGNRGRKGHQLSFRTSLCGNTEG